MGEHGSVGNIDRGYSIFAAEEKQLYSIHIVNFN